MDSSMMQMLVKSDKEIFIKMEHAKNAVGLWGHLVSSVKSCAFIPKTIKVHIIRDM